MVLGSNNCSVLLVEDDESLLEAVDEGLSSVGYKCFPALDARNALKILDQVREIDVIVSDIGIPNMDGIEFIRTVRQQYREREWLQVVFLTGHATMIKSIEALRLEATDFLQKPVRLDQLQEVIAKAAEKAKDYRIRAIHWKQSQERLCGLLTEMIGLTSTLKSPQTHLRTHLLQSQLSDNNSHLPDNARMLELLRTWDLKNRYFDNKIFMDPAWTMLRDLMINQLLEKKVSVSSIYIVAGVSAATAARRLEELETAGLVERSEDPFDGRRQNVSLTPKATRQMQEYLAALDIQISLPAF